MTGTFLGINTAESGLAASQIGQDVVGNNIANANTPGYTVENVDFKQNLSLAPPDSMDGSLPNQQIGTGVQAASITRSSDQFLDAQVRSANAGAASASAQSTSLQQIESAYGEPSSTGLNESLTSFYQSFNAVESDPQDLGARSTAVQDAVAVANQFQSVSSQLNQIGTQLSGQATNDIQTINSYGAQIASLNETIAASDAAGQEPNSLLDQQGQLLDSLSSLANINVVSNPNGTVNVSVGTSALVVGTSANTLTVSGLQSRGDLQGGDLAGVVQAQSVLNTNVTNLNNLAATVASQINGLQSTGAGTDGTTGLNFFNVTSGSEASSITVNPTLVSNPDDLAAAAIPSTGGAPPAGDGSNAAAMAALQNQVVTSGPLDGSTTLGFYQGMITSSGSLAATAQTASTSATAVQSQLSQQRESVTGVSTDQEMTLMLQYQNAYQASAEVVQTMNTMLQSLISSLFPG